MSIFRSVLHALNPVTWVVFFINFFKSCKEGQNLQSCDPPAFQKDTDECMHDLSQATTNTKKKNVLNNTACQNAANSNCISPQLKQEYCDKCSSDKKNGIQTDSTLFACLACENKKADRELKVEASFKESKRGSKIEFATKNQDLKVCAKCGAIYLVLYGIIAVIFHVVTLILRRGGGC